MTKQHVVNVSIKNNTSFALQYQHDWFDSGRLADGNSWPTTIAPGQSGVAQCYEKDWALTGCSGWVQYSLNGTSLYFCFSNPLAGTNGIDFGGQTSTWDGMTGQYGLMRRVVNVAGTTTWIMASIMSTSGNPNNAQWELEIFDSARVVDREPTLDNVQAVWNALPADGDRQYYRVDNAPTSALGLAKSHFKGMCAINGQLIFSHTNLVPVGSEDTGTWLVANLLPKEVGIGAENWLFNTLPSGQGLAHPCSSQACGSFMAMGIQKDALSSVSSFMNIYDMRLATVGLPAKLVCRIPMPNTPINGVGITRELGPDGRYLVAGMQGTELWVFRSRTSDLFNTAFDQVMHVEGLLDSGPGIALVTQSDGAIYMFAMNADPGTPCMFNLYQLHNWTTPGQGTCTLIGEKQMNIPGTSDTIHIAEAIIATTPPPFGPILAGLLALGSDQINTSFRYGKGLRITSSNTIEVYASDRNVFPLSHIPALGLKKDFGIVTWRSQNTIPLSLCAQGGDDPHLFVLDTHRSQWAIGLPGGNWVNNWPAPPPAQLQALAAQDGPDPHLFGLDVNQKLWAIGLPGGQWVQNWPATPPKPLRQITAQAGSDAHLFGLDNDGNLWAIGLPGGQWVKNWPSQPPAPLVRIAAQGGNDPHLFGLDAEGNVWAIGLPGGVWVKNWIQKCPTPLVNLAAQAGPDPHLFGLDAGGSLWAIGLPGGQWVKNWPQQPPVSLQSITAQAGTDAHLFALDTNNQVWAIGLPGGVWVKNWPHPLL
jgi:hypothetical protein